MKGKLTKRVVKIKKIQKVGENLMVLLPKAWLTEMNWNRMTKVVLEFLPYRKMIMLSELKDSVQEPIVKHNLSDEEVSDIIRV